MMGKLLILIFLFSNQLLAATLYRVALNKNDSIEFAPTIEGFMGPKKITDPENSEITIEKKWFESKNKSAVISCRAETSSSEESLQSRTFCELVFKPMASDAEISIAQAQSGLVRVELTEEMAVNKIYKNLGGNIFSSNETVLLKSASGPEEVPRLKVECMTVMIAGPGRQKCIFEFMPSEI